MNIVFASGFLFPQRFLGFEYFRGIRDLLPNKTKALFPAVPVIGSIEMRAQRLAEAIATGLRKGYLDSGRQIHCVAHSMGGLDVRYLLAKDLEGLRSQVASLTTIGTPHLGTPVADAIARKLRSLGVNIAGLTDLTMEAGRNFKENCPDQEGIQYFSIAGISHQSGSPTCAPLACTHAWIVAQGKTATDQKNDGLVSQSSAIWGKLFAVWEADHFEEIGHDLRLPWRKGPFPYADKMKELIQHLETLDQKVRVQQLPPDTIRQ